jgi:hypothetical protein
MEELIQKAARTGLSDDEAVELGHLYAEASQQRYSSAADERRAQAARVATFRVRDERKVRQRRWPFGLRIKDTRAYTKGRSMEIGQTASTTPEDARPAA